MSPAIHRGCGAAFTRALGIPTMRAAAAMHRQAGSGRPAGGGATGPGVGSGTAAAVRQGPTPGGAVVVLELCGGRLRRAGFGALRSTRRSA